MNPYLATLVYAIGIAGLFYLNLDESSRTSRALWLPVVYLWILGGRPVSFWLGVAPTGTGDVQAQMEGSPIDAAVFGVLLIAGLAVLVQRRARVLKLLGMSWPILLYFLFCLLSILWSDFPGVALKRWLKSTADLVMILVVLTDRQPLAALNRLFSRTAFIFIPLSILVIKYFPELGRAYDSWTGLQMATGLTTDKNTLGMITFVLLLGTVWRLIALLRSYERPPNRRKILWAQWTILLMGLYLLRLADSVTSDVCFALATALMIATSTRPIRRNAVAVHALVLVLVAAIGSLILLGAGASLAQALGRNSTLTGRTDIWGAVIPLASNPVIGAGFESFWLSATVHTKLWELMPGLPLNEAHNGYIEVYLELGWVGVCLISLILVNGYLRAVAAFHRSPRWGGLLIAYIAAAAVYNLSEAGFRMMDHMWIFLLLAVVASSGVVSGLIAETSKSPGVQPTTGRAFAANAQWFPEKL